jgi:hypothetical protein
MEKKSKCQELLWYKCIFKFFKFRLRVCGFKDIVIQSLKGAAMVKFKKNLEWKIVFCMKEHCDMKIQFYTNECPMS